jgi:hypothetical protein
MWRRTHLSRGIGLAEAVPMSARASRLGIFVVGAVAFAFALPSVASATDYCVGQNTSCAPVNHRDKFQNALTDAAGTPDADRILLGAETYTAGTVAGYVYNGPASPVEIVGAGLGKTVLTGQAGVNSVLDLTGGAGSALSDLTVRLPENAGSGLDTDSAARRIEVTPALGAGFSGSVTGVYLSDGATLEDSVVMLPGAGSTGVFAVDGHVSRSMVAADTGIAINDGSIERSRVNGSTGVWAYAGAASILSSVIVAEGEYGVWATSYAGVDKTTVSADGVTVASYQGAGAGVVADTAVDKDWSVEVNLTNSIIRGVPTALASKTAGTGKATLNVSYSDYDPSGNSISGAPNASINAAQVSNVGNVGFADRASGEFHLLPGSPLVDAGDPATAQGLDLDGNPLVTDGDGDGTPRRDMGAFELPAQPASVKPGGPGGPDIQAPLISGFRATPTLFAIGRASTPRAAGAHRGTRFRYTLSEPARVSLKIQRRLRGRRARFRTVATLTRSGKAGVNRIRFTGRVGRRALRAGRYRARITATDTAGNRSAPRATRFRIARP